jgi:hypothetical protein
VRIDCEAAVPAREKWSVDDGGRRPVFDVLERVFNPTKVRTTLARVNVNRLARDGWLAGQLHHDLDLVGPYCGEDSGA